MVMNFAVFDTNLHMIHHYRRVNSAKCVVNTSAPKSRPLRYKNVSNINSRFSTPTLLSTAERIPSRANSNCEVRRRRNLDLQPQFTGERSSSVPPRPCTRRNPNDVPQNYLKARNPHPKINDNNTKKIPLHKEIPVSSTASSPKHNQTVKPVKSKAAPLKVEVYKLPVPAPRRSFTCPKKPIIPDYEYLQFSLRITEDIIRNDLYSQKEMRRVFNSHIEANRGRLDMRKMLKQIDHLCKELNISKKASGNNLTNQDNKSNNNEYCQCETDENVTPGLTDAASQTSKEGLVKKLTDGEAITEEEMNELTENDLQDVITKILNNDPKVCCICNKSKESVSTAEIIEIVSSENIQSTCKLDLCPNNINSDGSFDIIHSNVENFISQSVENIKLYSSESEESENSSIGDANETEEKHSDCECYTTIQETEEKLAEEEKIEIPVRNNERSRSSIDAYDELLKSMLKTFPEKIEIDSSKNSPDDQLKLLDLCSLKPICSRKKLKDEEPEQGPSNVQPSAKEGNKFQDCLHLPICSGYEKEIESSDVQSATQVYVCLNPTCSSKSIKETEQNPADTQSSTKESEFKDCLHLPICSGHETQESSSREYVCLNPNCSDKNLKGAELEPSIEGNKAKEEEPPTKYVCLNPTCSDKKLTEEELNRSDVQPTTKEENKFKDCLQLPVCSGYENKEPEEPSDVQMSTEKYVGVNPTSSDKKLREIKQTPVDIPPTEEQKEVCNKDLCLKYSVCADKKPKATETSSKVQNQSELDSVSSSQKTKENEVSILAQKPTVDNMEYSVSITSSKTTQTSFTVEENSKSVISTKIDNNLDCNIPSCSKNQDETVYDNNNELHLEFEHSKSKLKLQNEKDQLIASVTKFVMNKTVAKPTSSCSEKKDEGRPKCDFVSTVEKLIIERTNDLYKYSITEKKTCASKTDFPLCTISVGSLDKYQTEYSKQYSKKNISFKAPRKRPKNSDTLSEGEVSKTSSNSSLTQKINHKIIVKSQPEILEHLKKYEQNKTTSNKFLSPCLCDYEIKTFEDNSYDKYVPKFDKSMFFPTVSTQTSYSDVSYKTGFNENLLSDGEIQNTSSDAETKTDVSENEMSWR